MKSLPFDLNFPRFENAIHLKTSPESNERRRPIGRKICAASVAAGALTGVLPLFGEPAELPEQIRRFRRLQGPSFLWSGK
jgi:hypothetical protein